ncbi:urea ABC transporter ATP-binding subunit UrtE [Sorangium sp. So ce1036]|uniref:urea ABC transporter ATP-binding subunit UrtE n=1 Tax=Sorangium sp. So ce1036 TaxID=3133328 RepID=UPI003F042814
MLIVEDLSVYYEESRVLSRVSLDVAPGRVSCLLGRNGVGKTTLLKAIMGVLKPRRGKVALGGVDLTSRSPSDRARAGIGYVPQGRGIFPHLTVRENLLMGFEAKRDPTPSPAAEEEMLEMFPALKVMRGRAAGTLSGGQQQQLSLARVLLRKPKLLLLDEPTEGIQPSIMQEIGEVIRGLGRKGDMAILLVEQFLDFALSTASEYFIMDNGGIVRRGSVSELDDETAREFLSV